MVSMGFHHAPSEIERRWSLVRDHDRTIILLAEDRDEPVGLIAVHVTPLLFYPHPLARVTTLVVDSNKQRQGIGRTLVEKAAELARDLGCERVELTTGLSRKQAHAFYQSVGFKHVALGMTRML